MAPVAQVTDADFDAKVVKSPVPVLVDFYGTWCDPCIRLKPVVAEIAAAMAGRLAVVEAEVSKAPGAAARYDVLGVPALALFVGGELRETLSGEPRKAEIMAMLEKHIGA